MNKEEIESLFKKYKVRIPKEKQGQSECYECKRHHKYSLTWTSFLYEYEEKYYCFEHIVIILLQQEIKKQIEEYQKALDDTMSEKMDLEEENKQLKEEKRKVRDYINKHCVNEKISKEVGYKCYTMADTNELEKIMKILGDK